MAKFGGSCGTNYVQLIYCPHLCSNVDFGVPAGSRKSLSSIVVVVVVVVVVAVVIVSLTSLIFAQNGQSWCLNTSESAK